MSKEKILLKSNYVNINIQQIPEGWLVKMVLYHAEIRLETVPDKDHIWKPVKADWQEISIFNHNKARAIKTPTGWLIYVFRVENRIKERLFTRQVFGDIKYIHDPENIFNPDILGKKVDAGTLEPKTKSKKVKKPGEQHCDRLARNRPSEKSETVSSYRISVKTYRRCGETLSPVRADTLEELRDILKNKYGKSDFTLISKSLAFDGCAVHNQRKMIPLVELNEDDCRWLATRSGYDVRYLE